MSEIAGFPELTVSEEIVMQRVIQEIKVVYQSYGYGPLETRLVEYADVLESKGIDGKEVKFLTMSSSRTDRFSGVRSRAPSSGRCGPG